MIESFYKLSDIYVGNPAIILFMACIFFLNAVALSRKPHRKMTSLSFFIVSAFWLAFAGMEYLALRQAWNIRVDLLFTWPLLVIVNHIAIGLLLYEVITGFFKKPTPPAEPPRPA